jgi:murein L,D-transpeptidase YcbB/YkuD
MKSIRARSFHPRLVLACALALATPACAPKPADAPHARERLDVREEIHGLLEREDSTLHAQPDTTDEERAWVELREFYAKRKDKPVWSSGRRLRREALEFREVVRRARRMGLRPADYGLAALDKGIATLLRAERFRGLSTEPALAAYDVRATEGALRLARDVAGGRAPSRVLDPDWTHGRDSTRVGEAVLEAIDKHRFEDELARLETRHQGYRRLRAALERHLEAAARGGWPRVGPGGKLQAGDRGPRVASLVRRLAATGDLRAAIRATWPSTCRPTGWT